MKKNISALFIAIAIVLTAFILSGSVKNRNKSNNTIEVTGLGKKDFTSDLIVWSGSFTFKNMDLKESYKQLDFAREKIKNYLISKGILDNQIVFSAINIKKETEDIFNNSGEKVRSVFTGFRLTQNVEIESREVDKIENLSRQVSELINLGIEFYSSSPQYYYTKLSELKIEMIAEATKDAYLRAKKIAENAGGKVGKLKNATMGVFQIIAQNSSEDYSWSGSFNTTTKNKTATITIKLEYMTD